MASPYSGTPSKRWLKITKNLLTKFPLEMDQIAHLVLKSWGDIFKTRIGLGDYRIGEHLLPQPQIMGFFLHELIPLNLALEFPKQWRRGEPSSEKDAHHIPDPKLSFEIKTSSSASGVFGNRSHAHASGENAKSREGYMLVVNFEKFISATAKPKIKTIRFGWLDAKDWIGQRAESGQQAHLTKEAKAYKLIVIWES